MESSSWRRDFLLLFTGAGLATTATRATAASYPLLVLMLTGSPVLAGWVRFASLIPSLLFMLPFGVLVDRYDRRRLLILAQGGRALALGMATLAVLADGSWVWLLIVAIFIEGALTVLHQLSVDPAVAMLVPKERLPSVVSKTDGMHHAANLFGQPLSGLMLNVSNALPLLGGLVAQIISMVVLVSMRTKSFLSRGGSDADGDEQEGMLRGVARGAQWIWRDGFLRLATTLFTSTNFLWQIMALLIIVLAQGQGITPVGIGLILGATGVGGLAGSLLTPVISRRVPEHVVLRAAPWCWLSTVLLVAVNSSPWTLAVAWAGTGFVAGVMDVTTSTYMLRTTPHNLLGRVGSVYGMLCFGASPLGALAGGYLLDLAGTTVTIVVACVYMAAIALFGTLHRMQPASTPSARMN
ncbi:Predicted arabinose efflux permease, MFS family [Sinosporangium album]|uniref:Predicted arabinose efflux permease, MFS family n=1 Tax=Sinosporangium album TaxID=504805 RepID=A0A1G8J1G2_9ACTN|nr:MFS transporter [Sinosporangium album]SDI24797.1 Predicted arabinose efflux permease, MFS family [Sinosporangium album]